MHTLDSRAKLLSVTAITAAVFFLDKFLICVSLVLILILFRLIVKLPFFNFKYFLNLILVSVFIIFIQIFWGEGLFLGLIITCRLFAIVLIFPVLTETTSPYELAAGLNALGFQYRIAYTITTALNMVPHFKEEARQIMDAQKLRGLNVFEEKPARSAFFITKITGYASICLPLVLGAMRKAQISSVAMDSRAFGVYKTRSWLDKPKMEKKDYILLIFSLLFVVLLLLINYADII